MSNNQYTQKSMEAIALAQRIAAERGHQQLEQAHLLSALLTLPEGLIPQLLTKMGCSAETLNKGAEAIMNKLPQVRGMAREEGKVYVSSELDKALRTAADEAARMKDKYISVEHLFLALLDCRDYAVQDVLRNYAITKDAFLKVLMDVRGNTRVTTDTPEETYEALKKYGPCPIHRSTFIHNWIS